MQILMYHQVGPFKGIRTHRATYVNNRCFRRQMAFLHHFGYRVVPLSFLLQGEGAVGEISKAKTVALTFDDGYKNFIDYALPVLQHYKFPATVYVLTKMLGQPAQWLADSGHETPRLMLADELRLIKNQGVEVGLHGATHQRLSLCNEKQLREEISLAKNELEALLEESVQHFCYPYGDLSLNAVKQVSDAGFKTATTCIRGAAVANDHPLLLPRKAVSLGDSLIGFWAKMHLSNTASEADSRLRTQLLSELH